jgi:Ala-tRNA(Pro) deacylase
MAETLRHYLDRQAVPYELVRHPRTVTGTETAEAAGVPGDQLAKPVVIEDDSRYMVVIIPATCRLKFQALHRTLNRQCGLATEQEVEALFDDCDRGAVPALAQAYGLDVLVDDALLGLDDVYFEAGDHRALVRLSGRDFRHVMRNATRGGFAEQMGNYGDARRSAD